MSDSKLSNLRKAANLSQEDLAAQLCIPVDTLRRWEQNEAIPSRTDVLHLSEILQVSVNELASIFESSSSTVSDPSELENQLANQLDDMFWATDDQESFFSFAVIFRVIGAGGILQYEDLTFRFSSQKPDEAADADCLILYDKDFNIIAFTFDNLLSVKPVSHKYGNFTFELLTSAKFFPADDPSSTQKLRLTFF